MLTVNYFTDKGLIGSEIADQFWKMKWYRMWLNVNGFVSRDIH